MTQPNLQTWLIFTHLKRGHLLKQRLEEDWERKQMKEKKKVIYLMLRACKSGIDAAQAVVSYHGNIGKRG